MKEFKWHEMKWDEMKWSEMKRNEMKMNKEIKMQIKTNENEMKIKMKIKMKMTWNEMEWKNEWMNWNEWIEMNDLMWMTCQKWSENLSFFLRFLCEIKLSLQSRAPFAGLVFQKCSETDSFFTIFV